MSMTREEAVPHYLSWREAREAQKAGKAIQFYNLFGDRRVWQDNTTECAIGDWPRDKDRVYRIKPGQAPTPRPVPSGDLTWEEAKRRHEAGETVEFLSADQIASGSCSWILVNAWFDNATQDEIETAAYRIIHTSKPTPKQVPLGPEDVPPGSVFRWDCWRTQQCCQFSWATIGYVDASGFSILLSQNSEPVFITWERAKKEGGEISTDAGKTWRPCSKPEASL